MEQNNLADDDVLNDFFFGVQNYTFFSFGITETYTEMHTNLFLKTLIRHYTQQ